MMKKIFITITMMLIILFSVRPVDAEDAIDWAKYEPERIKLEKLQGIKELNLTIAVLAQADELRVNKDQIRTDVEIKLRREGIKVKDLFSPTPIHLIVGFEMLDDNELGLSAYRAEITVSDSVILERDKHIKFSATIWEKANWGYGGTIKIKDRMREIINDLVDQFILDYLKAKHLSK